MLLALWLGAGLGTLVYQLQSGIDISMRFCVDAVGGLLVSPLLLVIVFSVPHLRTYAVVMLLTACFCIYFKGHPVIYLLHCVIAATIAFFTLHAFRTE